MLNQRAVAVAIAVALLSSVPGQIEAGPKKKTNIIKVLEATYGGNCAGVEKGNATQFVAAACAENDLCNYRVYYKKLGGDPAPECQKDFKVTYTCGRSTKPATCELPAEAGMGGEEGHPNQFCLLHCLSTGESASARAQATTRPAPANPHEISTFSPPSQRPMGPDSRTFYPYSAERSPNGPVRFFGFGR
jgi:hypothetical protein